MVKEWTGKIKLGEIEVEVKATIDNNNWYGIGRTFSSVDSVYLFNEISKRSEYNTQIGTLIISKITPTENTFYFEGTGVSLFK